MFDNIGAKIKMLAKVLCWIGIVASVISGIAIMAGTGSNGVLPGLLTIVLGTLFSWIGSFVLYGFGEMVENSDIRTDIAVKADMKNNQ